MRRSTNSGGCYVRLYIHTQRLTLCISTNLIPLKKVTPPAPVSEKSPKAKKKELAALAQAAAEKQRAAQAAAASSANAPPQPPPV